MVRALVQETGERRNQMQRMGDFQAIRCCCCYCSPPAPRCSDWSEWRCWSTACC